MFSDQESKKKRGIDELITTFCTGSGIDEDVVRIIYSQMEEDYEKAY